jgi:hypothetical protein
VPGPLYRRSYLALMFGTIPGYPAGQDFPTFGYESFQSVNIFVIYAVYLVNAIITYLWTAFSALSSLKSH